MKKFLHRMVQRTCGRGTIIGGTGNDTIFSGIASSDQSWASSEITANNYIFSGSGSSAIYGSGGNDTLLSGSNATSGKSTLFYAGDGNDVISAGDGGSSTAATEVHAGSGTSSIYGGARDMRAYARWRVRKWHPLEVANDVAWRIAA